MGTAWWGSGTEGRRWRAAWISSWVWASARRSTAAQRSNSGTPTGKTSPGTGLFMFVLELILDQVKNSSK